jgi:NADH dehydrogenase [ubiquinone] 1 alpha subcomplex assembly factor 3
VLRNQKWSQLTNILASEIPPPVQVKSITPAGILLQDGRLLPSACIFLDGEVLLWDVPPTPWKGWDESKFDVFDVVVPKPEILLIGTGKSVNPLPAILRQHLNKLGIQVDVMDSWNACTTYNLLSEEGRRVAAALLPLQHRPWITTHTDPS